MLQSKIKIPFLIVMKLILGLPCLAATSINYLCTKSTCEIDNNIQTRELLETELEIIQSYAFSIIEDLLKQNIDQVGNLSLKSKRFIKPSI